MTEEFDYDYRKIVRATNMAGHIVRGFSVTTSQEMMDRVLKDRNDFNMEPEMLATWSYDDILSVIRRLVKVRKFVVVTVADNGVIHTWADPQGVPFETRSQALALVRKMRKETAENHGPEVAAVIIYKTCEIMGDFNGQF